MQGDSRSFIRPKIVGSLGDARAIRPATVPAIAEQCDLVEIRLDLLEKSASHREWAEWIGQVDVLLTARRHEEGGHGRLTAAERERLLRDSLDDAAMVDIEVASIPEMPDLVAELNRSKLPWIASFHDFAKLPDRSTLATACGRARDAGASVFKAAAMLQTPRDLAELADFQLAEHDIAVATMGMGALAPVSRLLCAQCGSVLNYGYLGDQPTAPGQWSAAMLKRAVGCLQAL